MDDFQHLLPTLEPQPLLGEPSLADAILAIRADAAIPEVKRRHWLTSMTVLAKAIGRPPESIPCRMTALRHHIGRLNAAALGWEQKTFSNHKSNMKAAINHVMKVKNIPTRGAPLSAIWKILFDAIPDVKPRRLLSGFARYCSSHAVQPSDVTEDLVFKYFGFRETTGFLQAGVARPRELMKAWNSCVEKLSDWPQRLLILPSLPKATKGPEWEEFPETLRLEIQAYLAGLAKPHRSVNGRRRRSNKASTIITRRRELVAFARTAVAIGAPIKSLVSLGALLHPNVATRTFEAYLDRNGPQAKGYTIDLACKLLSIAKAIGLPAETVSHLDDIWARLEEDRGDVLTPKNLLIIRSILMSDVWSKVCVLPLQLMAKAQRMLNLAPKKALSLATIALQIQILTRAPVRIGNLLSIRLDYNLKRMGGTAGSYHLNFPDFDVKNRVDLNFELSGSTAEMIDQYINIFRPHLGEGHKGEWLFPGEDGKSRSPRHASAFIAATMEQEGGLRVTAHQFRHAAAAVILKERVGDYEFVRRILGHLNIVTTIRFYTALEAFPASKVFGDIIEDQMAKHLSMPKRARTRRKTVSTGVGF